MCIPIANGLIGESEFGILYRHHVDVIGKIAMIKQVKINHISLPLRDPEEEYLKILYDLYK